MITPFLIATNAQKILQYLLLNSGKTCYEREIARGAKISYGSANNILNKFYRQGIVERTTAGRMNYYTIDVSNSAIHEYKILITIALLEPLVEKLKPRCEKIILFGSCAAGMDTQASDIDLYLLASDKDAVRALINNFSNSAKVANRKIQAIIESPVERLKSASVNSVFMNQVTQGKILWEKEINDANF
ncbi:MAG: nucleotidyltransferase domain-containing protein [Elusimicrobia bacterium]|nr:nucleotidyltransferase domain-containing protein [Elusimicrobiota bacterium]